jgi:hypothetical protein
MAPSIKRQDGYHRGDGGQSVPQTRVELLGVTGASATSGEIETTFANPDPGRDTDGFPYGGSERGAVTYAR